MGSVCGADAGCESAETPLYADGAGAENLRVRLRLEGDGHLIRRCGDSLLRTKPAFSADPVGIFSINSPPDCLWRNARPAGLRPSTFPQGEAKESHCAGGLCENVGLIAGQRREFECGFALLNGQFRGLLGVYGGDTFVDFGQRDGHAVEGNAGLEGGAVEARKVENLQKGAVVREGI